MSQTEVEKIQEARAAAQRRRDGVDLGDDLLAFTAFPAMRRIICHSDAWPLFKTVFGDRQRTAVQLDAIESMQTFLNTVADVRNDVAHSRDLVSFERDLLSGISGMIRNQVSLYRSSMNPPSEYYPLIESVTDDAAAEGGIPPGAGPMNDWSPSYRLIEVGQPVTFDCLGFDSRGRDLEWTVDATQDSMGPVVFLPIDTVAFSQLDNGRVTWTPTAEDYGEDRVVVVVMRVADSVYPRVRAPLSGLHGFDDCRFFRYRVSPPLLPPR